MAAQTQLRLATDAEVVEYQIINPREMPWTIMDGKQKLMPGQYEDIRAEYPEEEEFEASARDVAGHYDEREDQPVPGDHQVPERESYEGAVFWAQQDAAVEMELELPTPPRKKKRAMRDLQVYLTSQARKMRWLLTWNHPSADADSSFDDGTKGQEKAKLKQHLKHEIVEALPKYLSVGGRWRLVYDETYTSAKKRKTNGTQPLEDVQKPVTEMDSADSESSDDALT